MKKLSNINVAKISCPRDEVCSQWLKLTRELHGLSNSDIQLAAAFLGKYIELKEKILDDTLLNEFLMSTKVKNSIREELGIEKQTTFQNAITSLRKKGFFDSDDNISKAFVPNITNKSPYFQISFILKINDEQGNTGEDRAEETDNVDGL